MGILLSAFMLFVPVAYEKHDKFVRLASALKEVRVGFILTGTGITFSLLISYALLGLFPLAPVDFDIVQLHCHHLCLHTTRMQGSK